MRKIRCPYTDDSSLLEAMNSADRSLTVFTTERFEPGEELLIELTLAGRQGRLCVRGIGERWSAAQPRRRVRAQGAIRFNTEQWRRVEYLAKAAGRIDDPTSRRKHVRLPLMIEVNWRTTKSLQEYTAALSDLSESGGLLLTDTPPVTGTEVVLKLMAPGGLLPIEQLCVTRHVGGDAAGLQFVHRESGGVTRMREVLRRLLDE